MGWSLFHTIEKDLQGFQTGKSVVKIEYQGIERPTLFEAPSYVDSDQGSRIPDYRQQLYWNPELIVADSDTLSFLYRR